MHSNTADAVRVIQDRLNAVEHFNYGQAERYEAALDDLLRNPDRDGPVGYLVRNASAYGLKRVARRNRLAPRQLPLGDPASSDAADALPVDDSFRHLVVEVQDLIDRADLNAFERLALSRLLAGDDAAAIAELTGIPLARVQERIARARSKARSAVTAARVAA